MLLHHVVVVIFGQGPHQPKVPDLDQLVGGQQDIAGSQVTVDEALGLQVGHALGHLDGILAEGGDEEMALVLPQAVQERAQRGQLCHLGHRQGTTGQSGQGHPGWAGFQPSCALLGMPAEDLAYRPSLALLAPSYKTPHGVALGSALSPDTHHLHGVGEHHAIEADEVPVVQGVHGIHLPDEVVQCLWLAQHIRLEALHCHVQLRPKRG